MKYIARINDSREPGGSDLEIKNDYNLEVLDRDSSGFDVTGSKEDIEAFIEDYGVIVDEIEPIYSI
jgi:hypothetical protein